MRMPIWVVVACLILNLRRGDAATVRPGSASVVGAAPAQGYLLQTAYGVSMLLLLHRNMTHIRAV
jgi:hypothetical protein